MTRDYDTVTKVSSRMRDGLTHKFTVSVNSWDLVSMIGDKAVHNKSNRTMIQGGAVKIVHEGVVAGSIDAGNK